MTQQLVLLGAGGLCRETAQAVLAAGAARIAGILDDDPAKTGSLVAGAEVLGTTADLQIAGPDSLLVATVASSADPERRLRLVSRLAAPAQRWGTVVHPAASLASSTTVGPGSIILAAVVSTADVVLGAHVVVMPGCVLTHDVCLGDGVTLASGVLLSGGVQAGTGAYIGAGARVREGATIGAGAVVGMGAVVLDDVPAGEVWAGVPARRLVRS